MRWLLDAYRDPRTYTTGVYLLLGLPLGILAFVVVVTGVSLGLALLVTLLGIPVLVATLLAVRAAARFERQLAWSLLRAPMPRATPAPDEPPAFFWSPRLIVGWGAVPSFVATALLGSVETRELKEAVVRTLARTGEADGFRLLDELELRLGRGPFLTPTRLEATLLALEATGHVEAHRDDGRTTYSAVPR
jgi:hypothetical protein